MVRCQCRWLGSLRGVRRVCPAAAVAACRPAPPGAAGRRDPGGRARAQALALPAAPRRQGVAQPDVPRRGGVHGARPLRSGDPGPGPRSDRHPGFPRRPRSRRAAGAAPDGGVPLAGPGRSGPLAECAVRLRLGCVRRRPGRDPREFVRDPLDSHGHRRSDERRHPRRHGHSPGRRRERQGRRGPADLPVPKTGFPRDRRRSRDRGYHRERLRLHREHPLPRQRLRRGSADRHHGRRIGDGRDVLRTGGDVAVRAPALHGADRHRFRARRGRPAPGPRPPHRAAAARARPRHGHARAVERVGGLQSVRLLRGVRRVHGPGLRPGHLAGDLVAPAGAAYARRRAARLRGGRIG